MPMLLSFFHIFVDMVASLRSHKRKMSLLVTSLPKKRFLSNSLASNCLFKLLGWKNWFHVVEKRTWKRVQQNDFFFSLFDDIVCHRSHPKKNEIPLKPCCLSFTPWMQKHAQNACIPSLCIVNAFEISKIPGKRITSTLLISKASQNGLRHWSWPKQANHVQNGQDRP